MARPLRLAGVLAAALSVAAAAPAAAVVPFKDIASSGPLSHVYVGNELSCQVSHTADTQNELFPPSSIPGDCGTFVTGANGVLYGPNFAMHPSTAASSTGATPFTPVSQSEVTGNGSAASPFRVTTVADTGGGLRLTQVDGYVAGDESYRTDVTIQNMTGAAQTVVVMRAGDCFLQGSDQGFGFVDQAAGAAGCSGTANNSPPGRIEQWYPITGGGNYIESNFGAVWGAVAAKAPFPNTCRCADQVDNGAGLSWRVNVPAGGSTTVAHFTSFSPTGRAGPPPSAAPPAGTPPTSVTQPGGSCTRQPDVCIDGPDDLNRLGCLRIGDFVHRFGVKLKKTRGGLVVNRVSRVTVVVFSLDRGVSGSDRKRPFLAFVSGRALTPGRHVLRANVQLKIPKFLQKRFPNRFKRTTFRRNLRFPFRTCS